MPFFNEDVAGYDLLFGGGEKSADNIIRGNRKIIARLMQGIKKGVLARQATAFLNNLVPLNHSRIETMEGSYENDNSWKPDGRFLADGLRYYGGSS
jgi:hypothetical protein